MFGSAVKSLAEWGLGTVTDRTTAPKTWTERAPVPLSGFPEWEELQGSGGHGTYQDISLLLGLGLSFLTASPRPHLAAIP